MAKRENVIEFENGFHGIVHGAGADICVAKGLIEPYDMTFGALASCFYSTLLDFAQKEKVEITKATITVEGEKRETVPTMLSQVAMHLELVTNDVTKAQKCVNMAKETCSMYQMISHVAKMSVDVKFL